MPTTFSTQHSAVDESVELTVMREPTAEIIDRETGVFESQTLTVSG
jgi:hypothetical protein